MLEAGEISVASVPTPGRSASVITLLF